MIPLIVYSTNISIINMAIGGLYWVSIMTGFKTNPRKRYYRKLLENPKIKLLHVLISLTLFIYGLIRMIAFNCDDYFLLFSFFYFVLLLPIDYIYRKYYKRTIILIFRHDFELDGEMNIWDKLTSVFILIIPAGLSFLVGFLIVK